MKFEPVHYWTFNVDPNLMTGHFDQNTIAELNLSLHFRFWSGSLVLVFWVLALWGLVLGPFFGWLLGFGPGYPGLCLRFQLTRRFLTLEFTTWYAGHDFSRVSLSSPWLPPPPLVGPLSLTCLPLPLRYMFTVLWELGFHLNGITLGRTHTCMSVSLSN
jgi:hypothetical protein